MTRKTVFLVFVYFQTPLSQNKYSQLSVMADPVCTSYLSTATVLVNLANGKPGRVDSEQELRFIVPISLGFNSPTSLRHQTEDQSGCQDKDS